MGDGRPLILVSNDDGIQAAGLRALVTSLEAVGDVVVVAPDRERSAAGHSLTLRNPLRVMTVAENWYSVDGTPTDCIALGLRELVPRTPQLVAAGINHGSNLGDDVTYSGTVASAMEATLHGIAAFAISIAGEGEYDFRSTAECAKIIAREVLRRGLPNDTLLNINVPNLPPKEIRGWAVTRQGRRVHGETVIRKTDPRGHAYYWIGGASAVWQAGDETDYEAVKAGCVSVTPLHLDLTNHRALEDLRGWGLSINGNGNDGA